MTRRSFSRQSAFTIVELLIVIVVIGLLAAIAIIAYTSIQQRARASTASSALSHASKKLATYIVDNTTYPTDLTTAGITNTTDVTYQYTYNNTTTPKTFCITATSGTVSYQITQDSSPTAGGCAGHGVGGVAPITNLALNPSIETNLTNAGAYFGAPLVRDNSKASSGTWSVRTTTNSAVNPQGIMLIAANPALPNTTYTCTISISGTSGYTVQYSGRVATSADAHLTESLSPVNVSLSASWQQVSTTITTTATTGILRVQFRLSAAASGVDIWGDSLICVQGSTAYNFADGGTSGWIWNGTANNSTSTGPAL